MPLGGSSRRRLREVDESMGTSFVPSATRPYLPMFVGHWNIGISSKVYGSGIRQPIQMHSMPASSLLSCASSVASSADDMMIGDFSILCCVRT